jgi:thioredoxin reductase (NADPH)
MVSKGANMYRKSTITCVKNKIAYILLLASFGFAGCWRPWNSESNKELSANHDLSKVLTMQDVAPVVIVGSGPAGLTSAIYIARAGMQAFVFTGPQPGGQLIDTTFVENWPGLGTQKSLGPDLMQNMRDQAQSFGACIINDSVTKIDFDTWPFAIETENGRKFSALSVILATGATPKRLHIPGEDTYWGKGLTTCAVCDAPVMKNKDVVIIGGGDTAAEQVFELAPYAKNITVLVRKDFLKASDAQKERILAYQNVSIEYNKEVKEIYGENGEVTAIEVFDNKTKTKEKRAINGVFLAVGHEPNSEIVSEKIKNSSGYITTLDRSQRTAIPGVFAAGEIQDVSYKQAIVAAGEGAKAALDATAFLYELGFNKEASNRLEKQFLETFAEHRLQLKEISQVDEFEREVLQKKGIVLFDFYADYCPGCIKMLPVLEALAYEMQDVVTVVKANHQKSKKIIVDLFYNHKVSIRHVPSLLVYKDGTYLETNSTIMSQRQLKEYLQQFLD